MYGAEKNGWNKRMEKHWKKRRDFSCMDSLIAIVGVREMDSMKCVCIYAVHTQR